MLFLLDQELINGPLLFFFKFFLFFFQTYISLKIVKLLLHCALTFQVLQYRFWHWLDWRITDRNEHWLLYYLIALPLFPFLIDFNHFLLDLLLIPCDTDSVLHYFLFGIIDILTFLVSTGIIKIQK